MILNYDINQYLLLVIRRSQSLDNLMMFTLICGSPYLRRKFRNTYNLFKIYIRSMWPSFGHTLEVSHPLQRTWVTSVPWASWCTTSVAYRTTYSGPPRTHFVSTSWARTWWSRWTSRCQSWWMTRSRSKSCAPHVSHCCAASRIGPSEDPPGCSGRRIERSPKRYDPSSTYFGVSRTSMWTHCAANSVHHFVTSWRPHPVPRWTSEAVDAGSLTSWSHWSIGWAFGWPSCCRSVTSPVPSIRSCYPNSTRRRCHGTWGTWNWWPQSCSSRIWRCCYYFKKYIRGCRP